MKKTTMFVLTAILLAVSIFNTGCNSVNTVKNNVQGVTMSASPMVEENNASKIFDWLWSNRGALNNIANSGK